MSDGAGVRPRLGALRAKWGSDRARPRVARPKVVFGGDPDRAYVLGERDGAAVIESWNARSGVCLGAVTVAGSASWKGDRVWRGLGADEVIAVLRHDAPGDRDTVRVELVSIDLTTGTVLDATSIAQQLTVEDVHPTMDFWIGRYPYAQVTVGRREEQTRLTLSPRDGRPNVCALSSDGACAFVVRAASGLPAVVDASSGDVLAEAAEPAANGGGHAVFSPRDETVWGVFDREVWCWDAARMVLLGRFAGAPHGAEIVAVSPDGRAVLLDGPSAFALGVGATTWRGRAWVPRLARMSPDGGRLARVDGSLTWHELDHDRRVESHDDGHAGGVRAIAVSRDGRLVATSSEDRTIRVCEASSGALHWTLEGDPLGYGGVAFAPDGVTLYALTHGDPARLTRWSLVDGAETTPTELVLGRSGRLEVSDDASMILVHHAARTAGMTVWFNEDATLVDAVGFAELDLASLCPYPDATERSLFAAFVHDRDTIRVASHQTRGSAQGADVVELSVSTGTVRASWTLASGQMVCGWSPGGRWLVGAEYAIDPMTNEVTDAQLGFFCADRGFRREAGVLVDGDALWIGRFALGADRVAMVRDDGNVYFVERERGTAWRLGDPPRSRVTTLALSPDEGSLYVGTEGGQVMVYVCAVAAP